MAKDSAAPPPPPGPMEPARTDRFPIVGTIATAIALALLIALGVWQLQRLKWKEGLLAHIAALQTAPAAALEPQLGALAAGRDVNFTRVRVTCPGLARAPFLQLFGLRRGKRSLCCGTLELSARSCSRVMTLRSPQRSPGLRA